MNNVMTIENHEIIVKEWNGQRVVTFKDIDLVHEREKGTAKSNFFANKHHFIEGEDFYFITRKEFGRNFLPNEKLVGNPNVNIIILTESGYLMLVKSFTDDLAWAVQRQLVSCYFKVKDEMSVEVAEIDELTEKTRIKIGEVVASCSHHNLIALLDIYRPYFSQEVIDFYMKSEEVTVKMKLPSDFNQQLVKAMKKNNMTQRALAKKIGVATTTINNYVRNKHKPQMHTFKRIAEVLNVNFYG